MKAKEYFLLPVLLVLMLSAAACATKGGQQATSREKEYLKMLEAQKGQAEAARQEKVLKDLPEMNAVDHDGLGSRHASQGKDALALMEYRKALQLNPALSGTRYKMGQLLLSRGLTDNAMKEFETIESQEPHNGLAPLGRGMGYFSKGDLARAREQFERALILNPALWQAHGFLGLMDDREERYESAVLHYRAGLRIDPRSATLYNNLGMSYYLQASYGSAIEAYQKGLAVDPGNRKVSNNLGLALAKDGRYENALEAFGRGKDDAGAYNNLGYVYLIQRKYEEAAGALEKAIDLESRFFARANENVELLKEARSSKGADQ